MKVIGRAMSAALIACVICLLFPAHGIYAQSSQTGELSVVNAESGEQYEKGIRLFNEGKYLFRR